MENQLKRLTVEYALAVLAGKGQKVLQRLLRLTPEPAQAQAVIPRGKEQSCLTVSQSPAIKMSDAEIARAQEIDRLPLPSKFDSELLHTGSGRSS